MTLNLFIIVLVVAIAFFHYTQGFFSATLSAIIAIVAAACALAYHEPLLALIHPTRYSDQAVACTLVSIFVIVYLLLRVMFDWLIPGNVRVYWLADKVGAAAMGLVAGIFTTGIIAIAAQSLPLGPDLGFMRYARYPLRAEQEIVIPQLHGRNQDAYLINDTLFRRYDDAELQPQKLILPVDDCVLGAVGCLSTGALAGRQSLYAIHPDYLQELFGNRLGMEDGAKQTAANYGDVYHSVSVTGLYTVPQLAQRDAMVDAIRKIQYERQAPHTVLPELIPRADQMILIVRCKFNRGAADIEDNRVRFTPASVRLVTAHRDETGGDVQYQDNYPIGTLENGKILYEDKIDDPLIVDLQSKDQGVDLVFLVNTADVVPDVSGMHVAPGTLFEFKRLARVDLEDQVVTPGIKADPDYVVMRPLLVNAPPGSATVSRPRPGAVLAPPTGEAAAPVPGPLELAGATAAWSDSLFTAVDCGASADDGAVFADGVSGTLKTGKFETLTVDTTRTTGELAASSTARRDFYLPPGKKMLQIHASPDGEDPWAWASKIGSFTVVGAAGENYSPSGAWATVRRPDDKISAVVNFNCESTVNKIDKEPGKPINVTLAFILPENVDAENLHLLYEGKVAMKLFRH